MTLSEEDAFDEEDESFYCNEDFEDEECYESQDESDCLGYKIVPASDILREMDKEIGRVKEVLGIQRVQVRKLLIFFRWDSHLLIERYYETDCEAEGLLRSAGISPSAILSSPGGAGKGSRGASRRGQCGVCELGNTDLVGSLCDHFYCEACWKMYIYTKVMDYGSADNIQCMSCDETLGDGFILSKISDGKLRRRYHQLISASYVTAHRMVKWCPGADCGNAARVTSCAVKDIVCSCGTKWCFECGRTEHLPLRDCYVLQRWLDKAQDESETTKWLVVNTKECPKCNSSIQKTGGCNHMICYTCRHDFCWICRGDWKPHGVEYYTCNKFVESGTTEGEERKITKQREDLERYHHYYDRYLTHQNSRKIEGRVLRNNLRERSNDIQQRLNVPWIEAQFLKEAFEILLDCRVMLKYSYVLAYYLEKCPQTEIFEENQRDLEHNTENLSGLLEDQKVQATLQELADLKSTVMHRSKYCESRRQILLRDVRANYEAGVWKYRKESKKKKAAI